MKNLFRISSVILSIILIHSCTEKPTPPVITTTAVTQISYTTATSGGAATDEGGAPIVSKGVCWNTSADPTIANTMTIASGGLGAFTSNLTQLTPNTLYYVKAYATNSAGTGYGNQVTFTTSQVAVPVLTTTEITAITPTTAVSGGNITDDKGGSVTARGVCWATVTNPTTADSKTTDGTGTGSFVSNLIGLQPGTIYYVRSYATNSVGTSYGNGISFTILATVPTLTTTAASSITQTTATCGGNITSNGGAAVTVSGVCWSTSANPTIALSTKTTDGTGTGTFTSSIIGLTPNTPYYVKAYATNSAGTEYGSVISFTTQNYGAVTDIDGNVYKTITIGTQTLMTENLKTTKYNDGTAIPLVTNNTEWAALTTPGYCWYNNDAATYKSTYGALYNGYAVDAASNGGKNVCPTDWHIWTTPTTYLGAESGFTALPGGYRRYDGTFVGVGSCWWFAPEGGSADDWCRNLINLNPNVVDVPGDGDGKCKVYGVSVRCLRD